MNKAIITGATGMIGVALIKLLLNENYNIVAIVRPDSKRVNNIPKNDRIKIVECDLSNLNSLNNAFNDCNIFFHFGWVKTRGEDMDNVEIQLKNVQYTLDAVKLAKSSGCDVFIGAGSQAEYGLSDGKLSANTPVNPFTGYGIAKYSAGKLSRLLASQLNIKHCWGRILSIYGSGDNNTMISSCINTMLKGEVFNTTKGEQIWDYLHCEDCARAFFDIANNGKDGSIYTIGSGKAMPLKNYIETIKNIINPKLEVGYGNIKYSQNQVMYLCADITKLTKDTGFEPKISFKEGIQKILNNIKY